MRLHWRKCAGDRWCPLETVVLPDANASGVVVIWSALQTRTIYLGQGGIAMNVKWARQFEPIARHRNLFATWASVPEDRQSGVRKYLADRLRPELTDRLAPEAAIPVNLPWEPETGNGSVGLETPTS
ncbi:MAG: hypothetical protein ACREM8_00385 [Vulcanimicrobiaceae bacterium]